jgi:sugar phosphate isomerase/epimerase
MNRGRNEWIECVHLKDAVRSPKPGIEYGRATPLGAGDADVPRVLSKLRAAGYAGPLLIELSADQAGTPGLQNAASYLRTMLE